MEKIAIIGVPLDLGGNRRGVDMGPSAMRVAGLVDQLTKLGFEVKDTGDIDVPLPEECDMGDPKQKYAEDIAEVCKDLKERTLSVMKEGYRPVVLGGDHSLAMGSISGVSQFHREQDKSMGLVWFDAHGDMNTPETSSSGNVHGMPLAHLLGMGNGGLSDVGGSNPQIRPGSTVLIGIRDLDDREKKMIADSGVRVFTMKDIDRHGISHVMEIAIEIASRGGDWFSCQFRCRCDGSECSPRCGDSKPGRLDLSRIALELGDHCRFKIDDLSRCGRGESYSGCHEWNGTGGCGIDSFGSGEADLLRSQFFPEFS
jgi:arginase